MDVLVELNYPFVWIAFQLLGNQNSAKKNLIILVDSNCTGTSVAMLSGWYQSSTAFFIILIFFSFLTHGNKNLANRGHGTLYWFKYTMCKGECFCEWQYTLSFSCQLVSLQLPRSISPNWVGQVIQMPYLPVSPSSFQIMQFHISWTK